MTETLEGTAAPPTCPPHEWKIKQTKDGKEMKKTPAEQKAKLDDDIQDLKRSPSRAGELRGAEHEKKAIEDNEPKMDIQACSVVYECNICHIEQEVDIVGREQIAEAKSRTANKVKKRAKQRHNLVDIQRQMNAGTGKSHKPLAKTDGSLPDADDAKKVYEDKGFQVEVL